MTVIPGAAPMPRRLVTTESSELDGRVALVSGGSRGVGRAVSLSLASAGAAVAVNFRRDQDAATEVVEAIRQLGGTAIGVQAAVDDLARRER
jgi:3-oxoacyl-[acyl-carrier protein] reductase